MTVSAVPLRDEGDDLESLRARAERLGALLEIGRVLASELDLDRDKDDALANKGNYDALAPIVLRLSDSKTSVVHSAITAVGRIGLPAQSNRAMR